MPEHSTTFHSIPLRARRPAQQMTTEAYTPISPSIPQQSYVSRAAMPKMADDDQMYVPHATPKSAIRYTDAYGREVRQQGNRRVVVKHIQARRGVHWMFPAGLGMLGMLALMVGGFVLMHWWESHQLDSQFGFPRTWQTDQVVGHNHDSPAHQTHFTFENLGGHVFFVEIPAGDLSKAKIYAVSTLVGDDAATWPVTAEFNDVNGDGRIDLLIHIQDQTMVYLNDGTGFRPQMPR